MTKYLYWKGILGLEQLTQPCQKAIDLLRAGQYKTAGLEQLAGYNVWSVRVNDADRLLFTTIEQNGQSYLLFLDYVPNHDYHKSRFLKKNVLQAYLQKNAKAIEGNINGNHFIACDATDALKDTQTDEAIELVPVEYYKSMFVTLTDAQNQVIAAPLPLVLSGGPGAGKTLVANSLIAECALNTTADDIEPQRIVYLTESAPLAEEQRLYWENQPLAYHPAASGVEFITYNQFLSQYNANSIAKKAVVDDTDLIDYLSKSIAPYKKQRELERADVVVSDDFLSATKIILEECRIASGYDETTYLNLGKKHCLLTDVSERKWVYTFYLKYIASLVSSKKIHPAFLATTATQLFDFIVVDEAQDLSPKQIQNLRLAAKRDAIVFCTDSRQNLKYLLSSRPFMLDLRTENNTLIHHHNLPMTLRCTKAVTNVLNAVLDIGTVLNEGKLDQHDYLALASGITHSEGEATWVNPNQTDLMNKLAELAANSSKTAVITLESLVKEAKEKFNTPLVFTVDKIKGLQYCDVIVYKMLSKKAWVAANRDYQKALHAGKSYEHRPKNSEHTNEHAALCAEFYTALSRAEESITLVEDSDNKHIKAITETLKASLPKPSPINAPPKAVPVTKKEDWEAEAQRLETHGLTDQAAEIRDTKVNTPKLMPLKIKNKAKPKGQPPSQKPHPHLSLVQAVFKTPSQENLNACLNHPQNAALFYDYPVNGSSLLNFIFTNSTLCEAMILFFTQGTFLLKTKAIAKRFSLETTPHKENPKQPTNLFWLLDEQFRGTLAILLMVTNPAPQQQYMTQHRKLLWTMTFDSPSKGGSVSLPSQFIMQHIANLSSLIDTKILHINHTKASDWHTILSDSSLQTSLINVMVRNNKQYPLFMQVFFKFLTEDNNWLIKKSPIEAWSNRHPYSTIDYLSEFREGVAALMLLQNIKPSIMSSLPLDFLHTAPEREIDRPERIQPAPPFFRLVCTKEGRDYLRADIKNFPERHQGITVASLTTHWNTSPLAMVSRQFSVLGHLAYNAHGIQILSLLKKSYPQVFNSIPRDAWCEINASPPEHVIKVTSSDIGGFTHTPDHVVHCLFKEDDDYDDSLARCLMAFDRTRLFFDVKVNGHTLMMRVFTKPTLLNYFVDFLEIAPHAASVIADLGPLLDLHQHLKFPGKESMSLLTWLLMDEMRAKALNYLTGITSDLPSVTNVSLFQKPTNATVHEIKRSPSPNK